MAVGGGSIIRWLSLYVLRNACAMSDIQKASYVRCLPLMQLSP